MLPQWPGTDVTTMDSLITLNNMADHPAVTGELIMAICWEETFFNNVKQDGGSALIDGWTACEQALQQIDAYETDPDATIEALKKSKKFDPDKVVYGSTIWRDLLFPTS